MNGMGKSSFLQVLLLLRQSYQKAVLENRGLLLYDKDCISLGTGRDVFYQEPAMMIYFILRSILEIQINSNGLSVMRPLQIFYL